MSVDAEKLYSASSVSPRSIGSVALLRVSTIGLLTLLSISLGWWFVGFSPLLSDVRGYARWSHDLIGRAGGWHLPGYPALIAVARTLTLGLVADLPLMVGINFVAWIVGLMILRRILSNRAPALLEFGMLVYGLFPMTGITHLAHPLADTLAQSLFLASFYAAQENRQDLFIATTAMGLMVHMALWPFFLFLSLALLIKRRLRIWHILLSGAPLALYYGTIAVSSRDLLWFFRKHYDVNFKAATTLPFFNAITGPMSTGSITAIGKTIVVLSLIVITVLLAAFAWRRRDWLLMSTLLPILLFAATVNAHEAFIVVRYAPIIVITFCIWAADNGRRMAVLTSRQYLYATALILVLSQWAYAAFTVKYFSQ